MKDVPFYKLRLHERDDFTRFWVDPLFWMIILLKLRDYTRFRELSL